MLAQHVLEILPRLRLLDQRLHASGTGRDTGAAAVYVRQRPLLLYGIAGGVNGLSRQPTSSRLAVAPPALSLGRWVDGVRLLVSNSHEQALQRTRSAGVAVAVPAHAVRASL